MGSYVLRAARDSNLYCVWSDNVEAAVLIGTRQEIEAECDDVTPARLRRADEHGTSALWPSRTDPVCGWTQSHLTVMEGAGGPGSLPRDRLEEYCRHLLAGDEAAAGRLVEPLESDSEEETQ